MGRPVACFTNYAVKSGEARVIESLLILIVLILLFGAAAVKGWIAQVLGTAIGFSLLIAAAIWVNIYFGEYGIIAICVGLFALFFGLKAWLESDPV
jgi:hypothetical protein